MGAPGWFKANVAHVLSVVEILLPCNCGTKPISESYHEKAWEVYCPNTDCIVVFVVRPTKELAEKSWNDYHMNKRKKKDD